MFGLTPMKSGVSICESFAFRLPLTPEESDIVIDDTREARATAEFVLSNVEAVLAGTLALMTALVQGCCEEHRPAIRRKVIANLAELEQHQQLSQQFRSMASHLQQHWYALDSGTTSGPSGDPRLWHKPSGAMQ